MNKRGTLIIFLTSAIVGALLALVYFFVLADKPAKGDVVRPAGIDKTEKPDTGTDPASRSRDRNRDVNVNVTETPQQMKARYDLSRVRDNPELIVDTLVKLARDADLNLLSAMLEQQVFPPEVAKVLKEALEKGGYKLDPENPVSEIGEIQRSKQVRWALNLEDGRRILVDMEKDDAGKWTVTRISLPSTGSAQGNDVLQPDDNDALGIIDAFMRATISQQFNVARRFVDKEKVADATIAGICILFEEGRYGLRKKMPLRNMFLSRNKEGEPSKAGYLAYIQSSDKKEAGNIGLTLDQEEKGWQITNVTLDSLLGDYATRFGGGDEYYTPLVKNPKGGDSLVLYFGFDEAVLTPRSLRQLEIVSQILKLDADKKIEISGHTDDLGSDKYNQVLSEARANAVRMALIDCGLAPDQIVTKGFGKKRQRREVETDKGDNAETIRRANRRAEIYLDF